MALETAEIMLPARGHFDLRATVESHGDHAIAPFRWHDGVRPVLERSEQLPNGSVHLLRIRPAPRGVVLEVTGRDAREIEVLAPLAARVRRALGLDQDVGGFRRACARDPLLRPAFRLGLGRLLCGTVPFEDVVKVLATSNRSSTGAMCSLLRLTALGRRCPARPDMRAFPTPGLLARLPIRRLRQCTGLGYRAAWVGALARDVAAGRCDLDALERLPLGEAARALRAVQGLGPLGVSRLLLLLGHHDEPVRDRRARKFARRALGDDDAALERWLRRQMPWRGLALWFAHRAAELPGAALLPALRTRRLPAARSRPVARS